MFNKLLSSCLLLVSLPLFNIQTLASNALEQTSASELSNKKTLKMGVLRLNTGGSSTADRDRFAEEIHRILFSQLGYQTSFEFTTYPRLFDHFRQGSLDAGTIVIVNGKIMMPESSKLSCTKHPYISLPLVLHKLKSNSDIADQIQASNLENYSIGYVRGLRRADDPFADKPYFVPANDLLTLFKMLEGGRIDLVLSDILIAKSISTHLDISIKNVLNTGKIGAKMCISHQWANQAEAQKLADQYITTFRALKETGELNHLFHERGIEAYLPYILPD